MNIPWRGCLLVGYAEVIWHDEISGKTNKGSPKYLRSFWKNFDVCVAKLQQTLKRFHNRN
jgi:hypothetical protein